MRFAEEFSSYPRVTAPKYAFPYTSGFKNLSPEMRSYRLEAILDLCFISFGPRCESSTCDI